MPFLFADFSAAFLLDGLQLCAKHGWCSEKAKRRFVHEKLPLSVVVLTPKRSSESHNSLLCCYHRRWCRNGWLIWFLLQVMVDRYMGYLLLILRFKFGHHSPEQDPIVPPYPLTNSTRFDRADHVLSTNFCLTFNWARFAEPFQVSLDGPKGDLRLGVDFSDLPHSDAPIM